MMRDFTIAFITQVRHLMVVNIKSEFYSEESEKKSAPKSRKTSLFVYVLMFVELLKIANI